MLNNIDERAAFIEACKKAHLNIKEESGSTPAQGIIIKDENGNRYTLTSDMKIVKMSAGRMKYVIKPIISSPLRNKRKIARKSGVRKGIKND